MIRGMHGMFYSSEPEALRAFFRDVLGFPSVDIGHGWLMSHPPEADLGVHPSEGEAPSGTPSISFYCDDIAITMKELAAKGIVFTGPPENHGYGLVTHMNAPGDFLIQLYQPLYSKTGSR